MTDPQLLRDIIRESIDVIFDDSFPQDFRDEIKSIMTEVKEDCEKLIIEYS